MKKSKFLIATTCFSIVITLWSCSDFENNKVVETTPNAILEKKSKSIVMQNFENALRKMNDFRKVDNNMLLDEKKQNILFDAALNLLIAKGIDFSEIRNNKPAVIALAMITEDTHNLNNNK